MIGRGDLFGKRGQEGVTLTTLLLIVLGVAVVLAIILGATGIFGKIFGAGQQLTSKELEVVVQSCKIAAENDLIADYCLAFKKVTDTEYIACFDSRVTAVLSQQGVTPKNCNNLANGIADSKKTICEGISTTKRNKVKVGGELCSAIIGSTSSALSKTATIDLASSDTRTFSLLGGDYTILVNSITGTASASITLSSSTTGFSGTKNIASSTTEKFDVLNTPSNVNDDVSVKMESITAATTAAPITPATAKITITEP